jgi:hypothetical protein
MIKVRLNRVIMPILMYCSHICLEVLRKTTKISVSRAGFWTNRLLEPEFPKDRTKEIAMQLQCLVHFCTR